MGTFWSQHRGPLTISLLVTVVALVVYVYTFVKEHPSPTFDLIQRMEMITLDTRFRIRGTTSPDPRIVIVDIDENSQEALGRWPFPRSHFATLLDVLREDGARAAAFDIVFSQPDQSARPIRELRELLETRVKAGPAPDAGLLNELAALEAQYAYDQQLAASMDRFGRVVLGSFFLYSAAEVRGLDQAALDRDADRLGFFALPQVRATNKESHQAYYLHLMEVYAGLDMLPRGSQSNIEVLVDALHGKDYGTGFFNALVDPDGVVRREMVALPYGRSEDKTQWDFFGSLAVQLVRMYLGPEKQKGVLVFGETGVVDMELSSDLVLLPDEAGRLMINYRGPARTYPYVSLADAVQRKLPAGWFKDKILLVGASAIGIADIHATPFGTINFPGVEIHANTIDNILHNDFLKRGAPQVLVDLLLILLFGIPLGLWLALVRPGLMPVAALLLVPFGLGLLWAFQHGWWLNAVVPVVFTLLPNLGLVALYRVLVEEREKRKVRGAFQQYLSPEVVRRLLENPELVRPRKTEISVLFSDIRGFATLSEGLDAQQLALLLNEYLTEMTRIIFRQQGTLDKYIGDAVMAFWGAPFENPRHAASGCAAALEMKARLEELRRQWARQKRPLFDIGIGLNTGVASVGNMGSELRYGYTAMGDAVNLASRVEGLTRVYDTGILVTESVVAACGFEGAEEFVFRELDLIRVKGKTQPVTIYELVARRGDAGNKVELVLRFAAARALYRQREWAQAKKAFDHLLARWPEDEPAKLFSQHCAQYMAEEPPVDWDGVHTMEHK
jgi:adenylate cyclase